MPHHAKPFFRTGRGWYVQLCKQQVKLCDGPRNSDTEATAWERYHAVMAEHAKEATAAPPPSMPAGGPLVVEILDKYLGWCQKNRAPRTYDWYHDHIQSFLDALPAAATLSVSDLKPFHVIEWTDKHPDWSPVYRRGAIVAVQRPFNWADELGYIPASPIKKIKKPQPQKRDRHITPEDFAVIVSRYEEGDPFRDLLEFAWHSGCRPQEVRHIEARHIRMEAECVIFPADEAKGKRRARVIIMQGRALEIVRRLLPGRPEGKLFRNEDGKPWNRFAIANRFDRLMLALSMEKLKEAGITIPPLPRFNRRAYPGKVALAKARKEHQAKLRERRKQLVKLAREHGSKFALYDARHGFCQRMLESGANHLAVAELMGHSSGRMVAETYSHMNKATAHLKETLRKAEGGGAGA